MNRFDKFLFLLQSALMMSEFTPNQIVDHLALVFDPNVHAFISQDPNVTVEFKVKEYLYFITGRGTKPFWLQLSTE